MSNIDEIPVRLYDGSVEDRHFMSKDEALRYVKDFFNREADKIDQNMRVCQNIKFWNGNFESVSIPPSNNKEKSISQP